MRPRTVTACALAVIALAAACTGDDAPEAEEPTPTSLPDTASEPAADGLPDPVEQTRAAILAAAGAGDYDALAEVIDPAVFLSDAGFGVDPVPSWRDQGAAPLEAMEALLALPHTVRETNEGTLYQWPRFTADSDAGEMTPAEQDALAGLLGEDGLRAAFLDETGYTGPRLGVLADGTWWILVLEPGA